MEKYEKDLEEKRRIEAEVTAPLIIENLKYENQSP